jgi:large subunit ribosomal protein LP2
MKEMAIYLMLVLGGNATPTADDINKALGAVGMTADSDRLTKLMTELEGKDLNELLEAGTARLAKIGGGGGGGGGYVVWWSV